MFKKESKPMIGFLLRGLKGLILGWLMSLVFFLVKRALEKALGGMPSHPSAPQHPSSPSSAQRSSQQPYKPASPAPSSITPTAEVIETIWAGMSATELESTFGAPATRAQTDMGEVWVYSNKSGKTTNIMIKNNRVVTWEDVIA